MCWRGRDAKKQMLDSRFWTHSDIKATRIRIPQYTLVAAAIGIAGGDESIGSLVAGGQAWLQGNWFVDFC